MQCLFCNFNGAQARCSVTLAFFSSIFGQLIPHLRTGTDFALDDALSFRIALRRTMRVHKLECDLPT